MEPPAMFMILLVEDRTPLRDLRRIVLEQAGHQVVLAEDGMAAVATARVTGPDLVVTDLDLLATGGVELIGRLRADPVTALIPIVAVTGDGQVVTGADAVLIKPYQPAHLLAAVGELLGGPSHRQLSLTRALRPSAPHP